MNTDATTLHFGDCLEVLPTVQEASVDSSVCDPPYELGFMGKSWDQAGVAFDPKTWEAVSRVLKPGAYLLAFGGTRTYHRLACAIEDAGFEIRDQIQWIYGSGFPKSLDVSKAIDKSANAEREVISEGKPVKRMIPGADQDKTGSWIKDNGREFVPTETVPTTDAAKQWDGWGTALKPAHEPIVVARKPLIGTVVANVLEHGTGSLNINGCRVELNGEKVGAGSKSLKSWRRAEGRGDLPNKPDAKREDGLGRFPANVIHDGSEEVLACFPHTKSGKQGANGHTRNSDKTRHAYGEFPGQRCEGDVLYGDAGSAARFFYCAKASRSERGEGNTHPTVKPISLMRYLCRLVTPPGGIILDPFLGSGTTGIAALEEGFRFIGIEREEAYFKIAQARLAAAQAAFPLFS